jgi:hypothetical protein
MNIDYTLWPNTDGNLGNIKVQIPTGIGDDKWPEGDALINNVVYKDGLISGFVDTKALILNDSATTTINYDFVDVVFDSIEEGTLTINRGPRSKYFNVRYGISVEGDGEEGGTVITLKYKGCKAVSDVTVVDANYKTTDIVDGVWSEGLCNLEDGTEMFAYCDSLTSFSSDLSSLTNGYEMFTYCDNLTSFNANLSSLTNGYGMFTYCDDLTSFNCDDLSDLINGYYMFNGCYKLTSFNANLSSLTNGSQMFSGCKLDTTSVQNIANSINDVRSLPEDPDNYDYKHITIDINNPEPNDEEKAAFNIMVSKGWTVLVNGYDYELVWPTNITTLDENGEETITPIPFYAKPVACDEEHARYVDAEGNFYNILGAQFIYGDDLSTYGMFTCEADAAANMRLTKIEKPQMLSVNR